MILQREQLGTDNFFTTNIKLNFSLFFFPSPLSDLPKAAVRILSNVTFLFVSLSYTAESAIVTAFITFIPKFIESQFGIPASSASIYTGELNYTSHCTHSFSNLISLFKYDVSKKDLFLIKP